MYGRSRPKSATTKGGICRRFATLPSTGNWHDRLYPSLHCHVAVGSIHVYLCVSNWLQIYHLSRGKCIDMPSCNACMIFKCTPRHELQCAARFLVDWAFFICLDRSDKIAERIDCVHNNGIRSIKMQTCVDIVHVFSSQYGPGIDR